jgi:hypothetical protein
VALFLREAGLLPRVLSKLVIDEYHVSAPARRRRYCLLLPLLPCAAAAGPWLPAALAKLPVLVLRGCLLQPGLVSSNTPGAHRLSSPARCRLQQRAR